MATEIERKFLIRDPSFLPSTPGTLLRQGYLAGGGDTAVRVRIKGEGAILCIKALVSGITRLEYEYDIPLEDAQEMLDKLSTSTIEKTRHYLDHEGHTWEVDVFHGANDGLVVAEVELASEDESVVLPDWVGEEVSTDARYFNVNLAARPYSTWSDDERTGTKKG